MYQYIIIDDEPLIRRGIIKKLDKLRELVCCCGEAGNGKAGIHLIEEKQPDFVILDMYMPVMNGMELLPCLSERYPDLPLIVISGYQNFDYMKQAIAAKAVDYLLKPFSAEEIQKAVRGVIDTLQNKRQMAGRLLAAAEEKENAYYHLDLRLLQNLILGYKSDPCEIISEKLSFINQAHRLVLFTLYSELSFENTDIQDWLIENHYKDLALSLPHPSLRQFQFILLFVPEDAVSRQNFLRPFEDVLLLWIRQQKIPLQAGISSHHTDISQLHTAFTECCAALDRQTFSGDRTFWSFQESASPSISIAWTLEEEFLFRIESGRTDEVQKLTDGLFHYYAALPGCTLADAKRHCEHLSSRCRGILNYYLEQPEVSPPNIFPTCRPSSALCFRWKICISITCSFFSILRI